VQQNANPAQTAGRFAGILISVIEYELLTRNEFLSPRDLYEMQRCYALRSFHLLVDGRTGSEMVFDDQLTIELLCLFRFIIQIC